MAIYSVKDLVLLQDKAGKKGSKGKGKGAGRGAGGCHGNHEGQAVKVRDIEPTLTDLPLSATASDDQIASVADGIFKKANTSTQAMPTMRMDTGRLTYELRQLLDNSDNISMQRQQLSGRLTRSWGSIARGTDTVFQRRHMKDGIDSAVLIAVDQSSSMYACMQHAAETTRLLADSLRRCVGTSFAVRMFSSSDGFSIYSDRQCKVAVIRAGWVEVKGWTDSYGMFNQRAHSLYHVRGGTPEVAALNDCLKEMSRRQEERKIIIWIGDGKGYSKASVRGLQAKYPGITILAFGLDVDLSPYFDHAIKINNSSQLAKASLKTMIRVLAA